MSNTSEYIEQYALTDENRDTILYALGRMREHLQHEDDWTDGEKGAAELRYSQAEEALESLPGSPRYPV